MWQKYENGQIFRLSHLVQNNNDLRDSFGIYNLIAINKQGRPKNLQRLFDPDKEGILYIGRSGASKNRSIYTRLEEFWDSINNPSSKSSHTAATHYKKANVKEKLEPANIGVSIWIIRDNNMNTDEMLKEVKKKESKQIDAYVKYFKELPPFNHSWPKAK